MSDKRYGFALMGAVVHLVDEDGYPYCEAPILYRRNSTEGYEVCVKCARRLKLGHGAIKF